MRIKGNGAERTETRLNSTSAITGRKKRGNSNSSNSTENKTGLEKEQKNVQRVLQRNFKRRTN